MTQLSLEYQAASWFIQRVPADKWLGRRLGEWRALKDAGWDVTAVTDEETVVAFGWRHHD